jgi:hypothetical protein
MGRYGLRSFSGPFDWYFTHDFASVIDCIRTDFREFLVKENLQVVADKPQEFIDGHYKMHFNHDVKEDFETEFPAIREKYMRRVDRLRDQLKTRTICFLRAVTSQREIEYIEKNRDRIERTLKFANKKNGSLFLVPSYLQVPVDFPAYERIDIYGYDGNSRTALRSLMDSNEPMIQRLQRSIPKETHLENLVFDMKNESKIPDAVSRRSMERGFMEKFGKQVKETREAYQKFEQAVLLLNTHYDRVPWTKNVALYGFGERSRAVFRKIRDLTHVSCFIDMTPPQDTWEGTPILRPQDYVSTGDETIIVFPTYAWNAIEKTMKPLIQPTTQLVSAEEFFSPYAEEA